MARHNITLELHLVSSHHFRMAQDLPESLRCLFNVLIDF